MLGSKRLKGGFIFAVKWGKGKGENELEAPQIQTARFFSYQEIKKITNNFSEENVLGVGGYGKVLQSLMSA